VLFHADHKNLITKGMDTDGLNESRKTMRLQTDANGDPINVIPAYILVPAALKAANRAVLSSSSLFPVDQDGTLNQNPGIINVVKDMAQVVVEPRLIRRTTSSGMLRRHRAQGTDTTECLIAF
jgi:phage major head subunit gpT-like protein